MNHLLSRYALLSALVVSILPHMAQLPWWLIVAIMLCVVWRLPAIEQRLALPNTFVKILLVIAGIAGIKYSYNTWFGPEAGTAFLIVCVTLKLLETKAERDSYILLTLTYFILATQFLFEKGLWATLYAMLGVMWITTAYISLNSPNSLKHALKKSLILLGQAVPLMLILYVFFPRLPPLWSMKLTEGSGKTGMSDNISPGDLAKLSQSHELAFRVEFRDKKQMPQKSEMYWRGLTLSRFDGKTWRPSALGVFADENAAWAGFALPHWVETQIKVVQETPRHYKVILEPNDRVWLYSLSVPYSKTQGVGLTRDFRLVNRMPVFERFSYEAIQFQASILEPELPQWLGQDNLQLPSTGNPIAREMAKKWRAFYASDEAYINALLRWLRKSLFYYTLEPPLLGENRVDDFLFNSKRGFCEHYSSAFAFLLRAAGIPTRVVVGYQGGELSPTGDSWQVRQMDAHAWVEAWLPQKGWQQIDPTAAVAPERIEHGMGNLANNQTLWGDSALSALKYSNYKWFSQFRNMADYINYRWQKDIVGYDMAQQDLFLLKLLGDSSVWKRIAIMFAALMLVVGIIAMWTMLRGRKRYHPADKILIQLSSRLEKRGLSRHRGEGVVAYLQRLQQAQPHWQESLLHIEQVYCAIRYQVEPLYNVTALKAAVSALPSYHAQKIKEL